LQILTTIGIIGTGREADPDASTLDFGFVTWPDLLLHTPASWLYYQGNRQIALLDPANSLGHYRPPP